MSVNACAAIVEKADPDRFAATMAAPVAQRPLLWPIYAFNAEVSRAPWVTQEAGIAEIRLQWWRDAVTEIAQGKTVRRHEVVEPMAQIASLDTDALDAIVQARRWDIYAEPFEDDGHLMEYLQKTSGGLMQVACLALAGELSQEMRDYAGRIGLASGIANWLIAVPKLEARGRIPLVDGTPAGVRALAQVGLRNLQRPAQEVPAQILPALRMAWRAKFILTQASKNARHVADGSLGGSEFRRRASLAWAATTGR